MKSYPFVTSIPKVPGVYKADRTIYAYKQFRYGNAGFYKDRSEATLTVKKVEIPAGAIIVVSEASKFRVSALVFNFRADHLWGAYNAPAGTYRKGYNVPDKLSLDTEENCAPGLHACHTKRAARKL